MCLALAWSRLRSGPVSTPVPSCNQPFDQFQLEFEVLRHIRHSHSHCFQCKSVDNDYLEYISYRLSLWVSIYHNIIYRYIISLYVYGI